MATNRKAVDLIVTGYVQGVGFRWQCAYYAWSIGVAGWVKNRSDGRVQVHVEGNARQIEQLTQWCQEGPRYGHVDQVSSNPGVNEGLTEFTIR